MLCAAQPQSSSTSRWVAAQGQATDIGIQAREILRMREEAETAFSPGTPGRAWSALKRTPNATTSLTAGEAHWNTAS
jgi:ATP-dependent protease ClpP protease subunit